MAEMNVNTASRRFNAQHRGRGAQVGIYLGKLLRMFIYQNDWKVLPMSALIAGLVGMVIRRKLFVNMEGTLMGAFAMVCVCIWNGCFNSIQVICRERDVIKREHRSGMHISSYIFSHMVYQALLCLLQTGITLYITRLTGVKYPAEGTFTPWLLLDMGISMFLITYASDMLSLWVSTLAHTTTTAMTIMPFVLIFQLVFSGGMLTLPKWTKPLTNFTISNPGLKVIAAQADTNNRPFVTISDMIAKMGDDEVAAEISVGQVIGLLQRDDIDTIAELRAQKLEYEGTVGELKDMLLASSFVQNARGEIVNGEMTLGELIDLIDSSGVLETVEKRPVSIHTSVGEVVDEIAENENVKAHWNDSHTLSAKLKDMIDMIGREKVKTFLEEKAGAASYKAEYANTKENITTYWLHLLAFILAFAILSTITLEFIDKDKR